MPVVKLALTVAFAFSVYAASLAQPGDTAYPFRTALRKALYLDSGGPIMLASSDASSRYLVGVALTTDAPDFGN